MAACWDQAHLDSDGRPARDARGGAITVCMFKLTRLAKQPALPCTAGRRLSLPFKHAVVTAAGRELAAYRRQEQQRHLQRRDRSPLCSPRRDYRDSFLMQKGKLKSLPPPKRKAQPRLAPHAPTKVLKVRK